MLLKAKELQLGKCIYKDGTTYSRFVMKVLLLSKTTEIINYAGRKIKAGQKFPIDYEQLNCKR